MGLAGSEKIKTLFQLQHIPVWERAQWPVLTDGESIVWTRRFGPAASFAAGPESSMVLKIGEVTIR
jgi:tRNA(Ile)-lysidine synthetase-like protein